MSEERAEPTPRPPVLREIDWGAIAPWVILFRTPGVAISFPVMLFAIVGVLLSGGLHEPRAPYLWENWHADHGLTRFVNHLSGAYEQVGETLEETTQQRSLLLSAWRLLVWSFCGLGVAVAAGRALAFASEQSFVETFRSTLRRWPTLLTSIAMVGVVAALAMGLLWISGATLKISFLAWVVAVLWPIVLLLSLASVILAAGALIGGPLLWAAVAVEIPDPFDAVSRLFAYAYQRIARLAFYLAVAYAIGLVLTCLVELLCSGVLQWTPNVADATGHNAVVAWWEQLFEQVVRAVYPAYFFTAATAIYLLLRQDIDGQPMDEIA